LSFFLGGLNPFKIQSKFKSQKIVEFIFQILFRVGSLPVDKVVPFHHIYQI
jgi:hypothetical protein